MSEYYDAKLFCDYLSEIIGDIGDFSEALQAAIKHSFADRGDEWQARLYSYVMESDCLDYVQINKLMEAANG